MILDADNLGRSRRDIQKRKDTERGDLKRSEGRDQIGRQNQEKNVRLVRQVTKYLSATAGSLFPPRGSKRLPIVSLFGQMEGTRNRGRQAKIWMENMRENLKEQGMNKREAMEKSSNGKTWERLVEASSSEEDEITYN